MRRLRAGAVHDGVEGVKPLKNVWYAIWVGLLVCAGLQAQPALADASRTQWPKQTGPPITNQLPTVLAGNQYGFLQATFHIETFEPSTTVLKGFIELTNASDITNSLTLCLRGDSVAYHIEMLDASGSMIGDPDYGFHNWSAQLYKFKPHQTIRHPIHLRLKDYFALKPGICQLLLVFDERLLGEYPVEQYTIKSWSRERLILHCE